MINNKIYLDAPLPWQVGFQDPATAVMEGIINFHHDLFFFIVAIVVFVTRLLYRVMVLYSDRVNVTPYQISHASILEIIWTIVPAVILVLIAIPSFSLLYSIEEIVEPIISIKIIGHQWYWTYELINLESKDNWVEDPSSLTLRSTYTFDSYIVPADEILLGRLRLLEVDNRLFMPININIRLSITSGDVLHSWAVPSLGIKVDACPGRINQISLYLKREGVYFGQCSEICGINHGFMPIVVHGVEYDAEITLPREIVNMTYPVFLGIYYPELANFGSTMNEIVMDFGKYIKML